MDSAPFATFAERAHGDSEGERVTADAVVSLGSRNLDRRLAGRVRKGCGLWRARVQTGNSQQLYPGSGLLRSARANPAIEGGGPRYVEATVPRWVTSILNARWARSRGHARIQEVPDATRSRFVSSRAAFSSTCQRPAKCSFRLRRFPCVQIISNSVDRLAPIWA